MSTAEAIPEPIPDRSDIAKGLRTIYLNRVAAMGMMLQKINRQNRRVEGIEKFAATRDVKDLAMPEDEDMGVYIGNEIHNHTHFQDSSGSTLKPPGPKPPTTPTPTTGNGVAADPNPVVATPAPEATKPAGPVVPPKQTETVTTTIQEKESSPWKSAAMVVLGAALPLLGAGAMGAYSYWNQPEHGKPAVAVEQHDWRLNQIVTPHNTAPHFKPE